MDTMYADERLAPLSDNDVARMAAAVLELDRLWEFDAERGMRDGRGGIEYERTSPTAGLRAILRDRRVDWPEALEALRERWPDLLPA